MSRPAGWVSAEEFVSRPTWYHLVDSDFSTGDLMKLVMAASRVVP